MKDSEGKESWIGTGHKGEKVNFVDIIIDGKKTPLSKIMKEMKGNVFTVLKNSQIGPYASVSKVTISKAGIDQDFPFQVTEDASNVKFMYPFMSIFVVNTKSWIAELADGSIKEGVFKNDNSFFLKKDIAWAAVYSPLSNLGFIGVYPEVYKSRNSKGNFFWDRKTNNKFYLQVDPPREPGEEFSYRYFLKGFTSSQKDFIKNSKDIAATIIKKLNSE